MKRLRVVGSVGSEISGARTNPRERSGPRSKDLVMSGAPGSAALVPSRTTKLIYIQYCYISICPHRNNYRPILVGPLSNPSEGHLHPHPLGQTAVFASLQQPRCVTWAQLIHVRPNLRTGSRHTVHSAFSPTLPHLRHNSLPTGRCILHFRHIGTKAIRS